MNVDKLEGAELDAAVAKAEGRLFELHRLAPSGIDYLTVVDPDQSGWVHWSPSRLWADGGPIIERELIVIIPCEMDGTVVWVAIVQDNGLDAVGDWFDNALENPATTPLIAAMRAFVESKQNSY